MARAVPSINNFNGGQASELVLGRDDLEKYPSLCRTVLNFNLLVQGGASKRPGTRYISDTKDSSKTSTLIPFSYSTEQSYVLEVGDLYIRYFANQGRLEVAGVPVESVTTYTEAEVSKIDYTQSLDVLLLAHGSHKIQELSRVSATSFAIADYDLTGGPFKDQNTTSTKVYASAGSGSVNLVADGDIFLSGHVGSLFEMEIENLAGLRPWYAGMSVTAGIHYRNAGKVYAAASSGTAGSSAPVHDEGTASDGVIGYDYLYKLRGYGKITAVAGPRNATMTVVEKLADEVVGAGNKIARWSFGAYSDVEGYPDKISYFLDRLILSKDNVVDGSVSSDYPNFARRNSSGEIVKDRAFRKMLNSDQANRIEWLSSEDKNILVGTSGDEFAVSKLSSTEAFGEGNIEALRKTKYGSYSSVRVLRIGRVLFFVDRSGVVLRAYYMRLDTTNEGYDGDNLNLFAEDILYPGVKQLAFIQTPKPTVYALLLDGQLRSLTYEKDQVVSGWAQTVISGVGGDDYPGHAVVEAMTAIPGGSTNPDELWLTVRRVDISGATRRSLEVLQKPLVYGDDPWLAWHVDMGVRLDNAIAATLEPVDNWTVKGATGVQVLAGSGVFSAGDVGRFIERRWRDISVSNRLKQWKTARLEITEYLGPDRVKVRVASPMPDLLIISSGQWKMTVTTISGLGHLEGREVAVYANGAAQLNQTVVGASITLTDPASVVLVGIPFTAELEPVSPNVGSQDGTAQSKLKRAARFCLRLWQTTSLKYGTAEGDLQTIDFSQPAPDFDDPAPPFSGLTDDLVLESGWDRELRVRFVSDDPGPCTILAFIPRVNTNG